MNYKEIQERLMGLTIHEHTPKELLWAFQLSKDLHTAIRALENIKGHQELVVGLGAELSNIWRIADKALKQINSEK